MITDNLTFDQQSHLSTGWLLYVHIAEARHVTELLLHLIVPQRTPDQPSAPGWQLCSSR